jgi:hypothetical protein
MAVRVVAYIVLGLFCAAGLFLILRTFVFRRQLATQQEVDLRELRRIDIEYGQKQPTDERLKR